MKNRKLREEVVRANRDIVSAGLVLLTWGNASAVDREAGIVFGPAERPTSPVTVTF